MHEIREIPPRKFAIWKAVNLVRVVLAEELHTHHGEDEDDDTQDEGQVTQGPYRSTHDRDQQVQRRPRFC